MTMKNDDTFKDLDGAVARALDELEQLRRRADESQLRCGELETLLDSFRTGDENPADMKARLNRLEAENRDLHERIARGREAVERLIARIRFLENQQP
jgi:predicted nuclease with TOPRIM domain